MLSTLYAAKKYIMPHLEHACVEYLKKNVTAKNACQLLSDCRLFEETEAMQRCWDVIDNQTVQALQSDSFVDIDYQTLEEILSRDTLSVEETVVFNAAKQWAEAECSRQGRDADSQNCREVLGDALYLLRFSTMTLDEFANGPGQSGLLNTQEISDIFFYHTARNTPKLRFPTTPRNGRNSNFPYGMHEYADGFGYVIGDHHTYLDNFGNVIRRGNIPRGPDQWQHWETHHVHSSVVQFRGCVKAMKLWIVPIQEMWFQIRLYCCKYNLRSGPWPAIIRSLGVPTKCYTHFHVFAEIVIFYVGVI